MQYPGKISLLSIVQSRQFIWELHAPINSKVLPSLGPGHVDEITQLMRSAAWLLSFANLVKREEIRNLITNEWVDLVPLGSYLSKLMDFFYNDTKYITLINSGVNK